MNINAQILAQDATGTGFELRLGSVEQRYRQNASSGSDGEGATAVSGDSVTFSDEAQALARRMVEGGEKADGQAGEDMSGGAGGASNILDQPSEAVSLDKQIKEVQEEIEQLQEEIQELQAKATHDESAKAMLKAKQIELESKQAQLTELLEQKKKQG